MNATDILKARGIKKSAQRIAIVNALQAAERPLTEEDIKESMGEMYDRVTFYRTAQVLADNGVIHRININTDNVRTEYALNHEDDNSQHMHFYCRACHHVFCLKNVPVKSYRLPNGYTAEGYESLIKGLCPECSKKKLEK